MSALVVTLLLAVQEPAPSAPAPATATTAEKPRVFVLDLKSQTVERPMLQSIEGALAAELARFKELDVLSSEDVRRALEMEASKSMLGCDTSSTSCLAEVANAMGAELVVFGDVEKVDDAYVLNLAVLDAAKVKSRGKQSVRARSLDRLTDQGVQAVRPLLEDVYVERGWTLPAEAVVVVEPQSPPIAAWATTGAGALVAAGGVALVVVGALPLFAHGDAVARLAAAEERIDSEASSSLEAGRVAQDDQRAARAAWESYGLWSAISGVALVVVGAGVAVGGVAWALAAGAE